MKQGVTNLYGDHLELVVVQQELLEEDEILQFVRQTRQVVAGELQSL